MCTSAPSMPAAPPNPYQAMSRYDTAKSNLDKFRESMGAAPNKQQQKQLRKAEKEYAAAEKAYINSGAQAMRKQEADQKAAWDKMQADTKTARDDADAKFEKLLTDQRTAQAEAMRVQQEGIQRQQDEFRAANERTAAEQRAEMDRARAEAAARAEEQKRIAEAPPAPPPNPSATATRQALAIAPNAQTMGRGRRKLRSDRPMATSLSIPGT